MVNEALLRSVESGFADVLMVAGRYTLADDGAADDVLPACERFGVSVVAAAIFNGGLTAKNTPSETSSFDYETVSPARLARVQRIAAVCGDFGVDLPTAALHFPFLRPVVSTVVVGGSSPTQVRQTVERLEQSIPAELWQALRAEELLPA